MVLLTALSDGWFFHCCTSQLALILQPVREYSSKRLGQNNTSKGDSEIQGMEHKRKEELDTFDQFVLIEVSDAILSFSQVTFYHLQIHQVIKLSMVI